jgi:hypothetical protein
MHRRVFLYSGGAILIALGLVTFFYPEFCADGCGNSMLGITYLVSFLFGDRGLILLFLFLGMLLIYLGSKDDE